MNRPRAVRAWAVAWLVVLSACRSSPTPDAPEPWFEETARRDGLDFVHQSGHGGELLFPEIMGGGVALFDMDGDGDLDAYLVQSGRLLESPADEAGNRLFENVGAGRFVDVSAGSGAGDTGYGMGAAAGDYDGDGDTDLYVTNFGPNVLLRNEGGGRFRDTTGDAGVGDPSWSASAAFLDYDVDGDLDLFVANYVNWTPSIEQRCYNAAGVRDYCLPTNYHAPAMDRLYRNRGDGTFEDVSIDVGLQTAFGNGLGVVSSDFDGDMRPDIFVANDMMMNQLWMNRGGRFVDEALLRGNAVDEHGSPKAGMGVMAIDINDDGNEDLLVGNLQGQTDSFFINRGGTFSDATGSVGLGSA
ncbi:MAG TPA: VCBS repeat-containing protein, partial [Candidatus Polarisedimenticolaceae bacterium]|nr:VCBS repeat-containing protein [Candidatus Polarisedimenticolaceae bacterium]